jgi:excisionase family DNA binding protein
VRTEAPGRRLLSTREVARTLSVGERTVRGWISKRTIPVVRIGRAVRVSRSAVEELIERLTVPARDEDEAE